MFSEPENDRMKCAFIYLCSSDVFFGFVTFAEGFFTGSASDTHKIMCRQGNMI